MVSSLLLSEEDTGDLFIPRYISGIPHLADHPGHRALWTALDTSIHTGPNGDHRCLVFPFAGESLQYKRAELPFRRLQCCIMHRDPEVLLATFPTFSTFQPYSLLFHTRQWVSSASSEQSACAGLSGEASPEDLSDAIRPGQLGSQGNLSESDETRNLLFDQGGICLELVSY